MSGIVLALAASVALNTGFLLQHGGLADGPDVSIRHPLSTARWLFASRAWMAGLVVASCGWALHVGALSQAPISIVQAFVAGGLVLALPIGRWMFRQTLGPAERRGIVLLAAALALLAVGLHDSGANARFGAVGLGLFLAVASAAAAALVLAPDRGRRGHALGLAGGLLYGAADVAIKALTGIASAHGVEKALLSPWLIAAALTTLGAAFCFQRGLQTGRALPVIALMTAATNALSICAGFLVFGDSLGSTPILAAMHATALVVIVVAAARLAPAAA